MSEYFTYFPTIEHDLTNVGQTVTLTNVLRRFIVRNDLQERSDIFYKYNVQMGDRPDIIAEKYYGDADLAWLVLHFNDIKDPIFDFPLFGQDFDNYIKGKYGSVPAARSEVHEYRQILQEADVKFDGTKIPERYVVIDNTTADDLATGEILATVSSGSVSSTTIRNTGSYTTTSIVPTITFDAPTTKTATAISGINQATGVVDEVNVVELGSGYTSVPTVTIVAPTSGTQATATAVMDSSGTRVERITITNGGSGYTKTPLVTIAPPVQGTTATGTVTLDSGKLKTVTITNSGTGYTFPPSITITGGTKNTLFYSISKYDYEEELNEKKREIKLLDKRYADKVRDEIETVLRNGI